MFSTDSLHPINFHPCSRFCIYQEELLAKRARREPPKSKQKQHVKFFTSTSTRPIPASSKTRNTPPTNPLGSAPISRPSSPTLDLTRNRRPSHRPLLHHSRSRLPTQQVTPSAPFASRPTSNINRWDGTARRRLCRARNVGGGVDGAT